MLAPKITITSIAILMGVVSTAIFRKQATAATCPVHNRYAGTLAIIVAWALIMGSVGLVIYAWFLIDA